jgi:CheY-like chemotaxis protein
MTVKPEHTILLVEDSPEDYAATVRAFKKAGLANPIVRCANGDDALDFLYRRGGYADATHAPRPGVILLDLNLPGTDGRTVLAEVKADAALRAIPVIVLTTSCDERDVASCYQAGANSFVQKPVSLERFFQAVQRLKEYWFEVVILPRPA